MNWRRRRSQIRAFKTKQNKRENQNDVITWVKTKSRGFGARGKTKEKKTKEKLNLLGDETAKRITGRDVIVTEVVVVVQMQFRIVIGFTLQTGVRWHTGKRTKFTNTHTQQTFHSFFPNKKRKRKTEKNEVKN
jgi:hypothetical protein